MTYDIKPIIIKTKTNLHVGDGSTNFDIVDKSVQRDSINKLPIINASSLKGALKDYYWENKTLDDKVESKDLNNLEKGAFDKLFGSDNKQYGLIKFLDTYMLFLPLRSDKKPYFHVTSKDNLTKFIEFLEELGYKDLRFAKAKELITKLKDNIVIKCDNAFVEDVECNRDDTDLKDLLEILPENMRPENIAIFSNENFIDAIEHLPIIARNKLKNGISENLWYEEIVPRESIFYTAMLDYNNYGRIAEYKYKKGFQAFFNILEQDFIQVGANASIGYGLCKFKVLGEKK